jgi:nitroimidazol reductase NimA-like FMN-containing flavoprotein (pyridoxamine 5'-phosphate oxidase superfamily)
LSKHKFSYIDAYNLCGVYLIQKLSKHKSIAVIPGGCNIEEKRKRNHRQKRNRIDYSSIYGTPYVVPLCFGYDNGALFFHSAKEGRKIEILKKNNQVCFEFDIAPEVQSGKTACAWGMKYRSIIGFGEALFVEDPDERRKALDIIMRQYADGDFEYSEKAFKEALVIKVEIESMTGKKSN